MIDFLHATHTRTNPNKRNQNQKDNLRITKHRAIKNAGLSLIELMIATVIATFMSITVFSLFIHQTAFLSRESQRDNTAQEANQSFDKISRLLRHAQKKSIDITYPNSIKANTEKTPEIKNDAIRINFNLPIGFNIWPNDVPPYDQNKIRLQWSNSSSDEKSYIIQIANASDAASITKGDMKDLTGDNSNDQPRIINLDFWPLASQRKLQSEISRTAINGYLLRITTRTATPDLSYLHPNVAEDNPFKHYRTHTVSGVISPRN